MEHRLEKALRIVNRKKEIPVPEFEESLPEIAVHARTAEADVRLMTDRSLRRPIVEFRARPGDEHMRSIDAFRGGVVDPCPDFAVIMKLNSVISFKQAFSCLARRIFRVAVIDKNQIVEIVHDRFSRWCYRKCNPGECENQMFRVVIFHGSGLEKRFSAGYCSESPDAFVRWSLLRTEIRNFTGVER